MRMLAPVRVGLGRSLVCDVFHGSLLDGRQRLLDLHVVFVGHAESHAAQVALEGNVVQKVVHRLLDILSAAYVHCAREAARRVPERTLEITRYCDVHLAASFVNTTLLDVLRSLDLDLGNGRCTLPSTVSYHRGAGRANPGITSHSSDPAVVAGLIRGVSYSPPPPWLVIPFGPGAFHASVVIIHHRGHSLAPATGFEPTISGLTSRRFKPLSYAGALVVLEGFEPTTHGI